MPNKPLFSVVLAVHNEAHNIERCLQPFQKLADEIIVVDGESTDATAEAAEKLGARVIRTSNKSNFHINKQMAMDAAQGSLVLQLDADEVADDELLAFIKQLKQQLHNRTLPQQPKAWWIRRKNYFLGTFLKKGGQYPDPVIRLYQAGSAHLPQKNVHEQMEVEGETELAAGHLLHYANPDFATYMRKFNTYTSFEAERLLEHGEVGRVTWWRYWLLLPFQTFFSRYLRHRGYFDGMPGFVFALMSSLHHPIVYLKVKELLFKSEKQQQ